MNEMFFYQERGKTVGPFTADDIKGRIKDGRIRVFDLLYKDGEESWRMALEHQSLSSEFKSTTMASLKERPWVCLQRKAPKSNEFVTSGPFTQEEIRVSLQNGKISYSDYAWKDSLAEWKRIGSLEEFNPRARSTALPPVPSVPQESGADLLKNVVEFQRPLPVNTAFEEVPEEAHSDFTPQGAAAFEPTVIKKKPEPEKPKEKIVPKETVTVTVKQNLREDTVTQTQTIVKAKAESPVSPPPVPSPTAAQKSAMVTIKGDAHPPKREPVEAKPDLPPPVPVQSPYKKIQKAQEMVTADEEDVVQSRRWLDWSLVGVLVLVLVAVVLIVSRFVMPKTPVNVPEPSGTAVNEAPAPIVPPPAPPPVKAESQAKFEPPAPPPPASAPEPPPPQPKEPTDLILAVHASSGQPQIEIRTDGTSEYPLHVQIVGLPGQVTEGGGFYRYIRLVPKGKLKENIEIPGLKLPQGKFIIRAEAGEIKKETKFSWGLNDPAYKNTMARQRKTWAYALWKERLNLFILAQALEKQITQAMVPSKKFQAKKWDSLINLKRTDGAKYLMFDEWWELHNIAKEAKTAVNGALASRALKEREHLAVFSVWK